ncbi:hypothetical protein J132_02349 [Termitomyces sp. J132]|nr:hypothetical protein J132_02349 [Termitomyces sp. J132]
MPHSATGVSPFYTNKGYNPQLMLSLKDIPSHITHEVAKDLQSLLFKILQKVSTHAYRLDLPPGLKGLHLVFHVRFLEKHAPDHFSKQHSSQLPPIKVKDKYHYKVNQIFDSHLIHSQPQYLVHWKGYGPEDDTWEPQRNFNRALAKLQDFY